MLQSYSWMDTVSPQDKFIQEKENQAMEIKTRRSKRRKMKMIMIKERKGENGRKRE